MATGIAEEEQGPFCTDRMHTDMCAILQCDGEVRGHAAARVHRAHLLLMPVGRAHIIPREGRSGHLMDEGQVEIFVAHRRIGVVKITRHHLCHSEIDPVYGIDYLPGRNLVEQDRHTLLCLIQRQMIEYPYII